MSASLNPVVPTTACTPCIASHGSVTRAASAVVKSTTTSHAGIGQRSQLAGDGDAVHVLSPIEPSIDGCDQIEIAVEGDRRADRAPHPPTCTDDTDLDLRHARDRSRRSDPDGRIRWRGRR